MKNKDIKKVIRSDCHIAPVEVKWHGDIYTAYMTNYYICSKCKKTCNPVEVLQVKDWKKLDEN